MKKYIIALAVAGATWTMASTAQAGVQIVFSAGYGRPACYQPVRYYSPCPPPVVYYGRPYYSHRGPRYVRYHQPPVYRERIHRPHRIQHGCNRGYRW